MSARLVLWVLWTALSLCLPSSARVELCLCDGVAGWFDGRACAASEPAPEGGCCLGAGAEEDLGPIAGVDAPSACRCLTLELGHEEGARHAAKPPQAPQALAPSRLEPIVVPTPASALRTRRVRHRPPATCPFAAPLRL